jgi:hypothetical protein
MNKTDLEKLSRVLGLLGSDQAGERASAALAAHRLLESTGASWQQLLQPAVSNTRTRSGRRSGEYGLDYLEAAESRIRQLRRENERLEAQVRLLKSRLETAKEQLGRAGEQAVITN